MKACTRAANAAFVKADALAKTSDVAWAKAEAEGNAAMAAADEAKPSKAV